MKLGIVCGKDKFPTNYVRWVKNNGLQAVIISRRAHLEKIKDLDGLIFTGGGDLKHYFYSAEKVGVEGDWVRDCFEYQAFLRGRNKALLGVCRGAQVLNVFLGGTICDMKNSSLHKGEKDVYHKMFVQGRILTVNSMHHQRIDRLAPDFFAFGVFGQVIEWAESKTAILLQFHPERMNDRFFMHRFKNVIKAKRKHKIYRGVEK
ncbi:MAG: gamma-glutamyl-gamma-aminobutyrate hydrolase family protein [Clostridia bacterium]|nr:gamma-glutamyl-gamma-aminobutyrate hydrolase family protein [Clostridia bacterium]